jgi:hypothetical protein
LKRYGDEIILGLACAHLDEPLDVRRPGKLPCCDLGYLIQRQTAPIADVERIAFR